jgi:hypothetical protein
VKSDGEEEGPRASEGAGSSRHMCVYMCLFGSQSVVRTFVVKYTKYIYVAEPPLGKTRQPSNFMSYSASLSKVLELGGGKGLALELFLDFVLIGNGQLQHCNSGPAFSEFYV